MADINITAVNPRTRRVTFAFQIVPKKTSGMETLLQLCAKTVLTTPGKDVFAPRYGGGLMTYSGRNLITDDIPRISADMAYIIKRSEEQILLEQAAMDIAPYERLRSLTLLSIDYLPDEGALDVRALVVSEVGDRADISLANQIRFKRHEEVTDEAGALWKLFQELSGVERQIAEYVFGYNDKPILPVSEVGKILGVSTAFVVDTRSKLTLRRKELQK